MSRPTTKIQNEKHNSISKDNSINKVKTTQIQINKLAKTKKPQNMTLKHSKIETKHMLPTLPSTQVDSRLERRAAGYRWELPARGGGLSATNVSNLQIVDNWLILTVLSSTNAAAL